LTHDQKARVLWGGRNCTAENQNTKKWEKAKRGGWDWRRAGLHDEGSQGPRILGQWEKRTGGTSLEGTRRASLKGLGKVQYLERIFSKGSAWNPSERRSGGRAGVGAWGSNRGSFVKKRRAKKTGGDLSWEIGEVNVTMEKKRSALYGTKVWRGVLATWHTARRGGGGGDCFQPKVAL